MSDLEKKIQQAEARLKDLKSVAKKQQRRDEHRRKILYGAAVLKLLDDYHGESRAKLVRLLHAKIIRASDRKFLGLGDSGMRCD